MRILSRESFLFLLLVFSCPPQEALRPFSHKRPSLLECLRAHAACDEMQPCLRCHSGDPLCQGYHKALAAASLGQCQAMARLCTPELREQPCDTRVPYLPFQEEDRPRNLGGPGSAPRGRSRASSRPSMTSETPEVPDTSPFITEVPATIGHLSPQMPVQDEPLYPFPPSSSPPTLHSLIPSTSPPTEAPSIHRAGGISLFSPEHSGYFLTYSGWQHWVLPLVLLGALVLLILLAVIFCECRAQQVSRAIRCQTDTVQALAISIRQGNRSPAPAQPSPNPTQQGSVPTSARGTQEYHDDRLADLNPEYEEIQPFPGTERSSSFTQEGMGHLYLSPSASPSNLRPPPPWQLRSTGFSTLPSEPPKPVPRSGVASDESVKPEPEWPEARPQVASLSLRPSASRF